MAEKLHVLKGPRNAQGCDAVRFKMRNILAFKKDLTLVRLVKPIDAVQKTGFPRAVGADNGEYFALFDAGGYAMEGFDAPETEMDVL